MTKVEVFHDQKVLVMLSKRSRIASQIDASIKGWDRPFLRPGYRANKICSPSVDQGLRETLADKLVSIRNEASFASGDNLDKAFCVPIGSSKAT
jgi:hypothetical protein